jgi:hypothetical protein
MSGITSFSSTTHPFPFPSPPQPNEYENSIHKNTKQDHQNATQDQLKHGREPAHGSCQSTDEGWDDEIACAAVAASSG